MPAWADTVSLVASKDNTLFEMAGHPDLSNGQGELFAGGIAQQDPNGNAYKRRALVQFDLSSIPAGATITGATLRMQVTRTISSTYQFNVYRMLASWGEGASGAGSPGGRGAPAAPGDVTWNYRFFGDPSTAWATPGGDFDPAIVSSTMIGSVGSYSWSGPGLASGVQAWLDGTVPNDGWMITSNLEFLTTIAKRLASRENSTPSFRPTLIVDYTVPAPASLLVLGSLGGLAGRRRR
jgi:hypothetical protein